MVMKSNVEALKLIQNKLKSDIKDGRKIKYYIPSLWVNSSPKNMKDIKVNPFEFYKNKIDEILRYKSFIKNLKEDLNGQWSRKAVVYNIFVRLVTAYDHDKNNKIDINVNESGWRETGTFLKTIAILPYLKKIGINTLHFLPITSIGSDGNKGNLGSPYAIKNPYKLDDNLSEPVLGFDTDIQFKALVEAAKRMGFRIILEFVFRTASKDSDWIPEYPEWFYWIKDNIELRNSQEKDEKKYGSPLFTQSELDTIHHLVNSNKMDALIEPHEAYKKMFTEIPVKVDFVKEKYIGTTATHVKTKIPGAFADWPPDDNQPPWSDVTYLRMFNHKSFNYIAYNTIRMYDSRLAALENKNETLWDKIINIIPHYQKDFNIDGVMIDMGHALPPELLKEIQRHAREINPYFSFWEENFSLTEKSIQQGYNVTLGYLWCDEHHLSKLKAILNILSTTGFPLPFFATAETHNTPRAVKRNGGIIYSKYAFGINCFLPAVLFLHSGFELAVDYPINTGLDFTTEEQKKYPSEKLPLFSDSLYNWNNKNNIIDYIIKILRIRKQYQELITDRNPKSFGILECDSNEVICFYRKSMKSNKVVYIIANSNFEEEKFITLKVSGKDIILSDRIKSKKMMYKKGVLNLQLNPGEVKIFGN
jgi:starch synthase (maltosyl-transferring)